MTGIAENYGVSHITSLVVRKFCNFKYWQLANELLVIEYIFYFIRKYKITVQKINFVTPEARKKRVRINEE